MKFSPKNFLTIMQARMLIFGLQVVDNISYCGLGHQPSLAYPSQYLSSFLFFHILRNQLFLNFSTPIQARMLIFGKPVDDGLLYGGIEKQSFPAYSYVHLSNFLSFHTLKNEMFRQKFLNNLASKNAHIW